MYIVKENKFSMMLIKPPFGGGMERKMNDWKEVWEERSVDSDVLLYADKESIFWELKRSSGFDITGNGLTYEALLAQYRCIKKELFFAKDSETGRTIRSVYEVGCGSGANLFLLENDGIQCGGIDYSQVLVESAKKVLRSQDILCDEAVNMPEEPKYDAMLSNSVFSYFVDEGYAYAVLEKMYQKTNCTIGIIDIHNIEKKEDFIAYRKRNVADYEERYKNLPKLFYAKQFFMDFAESHGMDIKFTHSNTKGYWNNDYVFHCYMYK